jgi:hypothetical protein
MRYGYDVLEHRPLLCRAHLSSCLACNGVQSSSEASRLWCPRLTPPGRQSPPAARRQHRRVDWDGWRATAYGQRVVLSWSGTLIAWVRSVDGPSQGKDFPRSTPRPGGIRHDHSMHSICADRGGGCGSVGAIVRGNAAERRRAGPPTRPGGGPADGGNSSAH